METSRLSACLLTLDNGQYSDLIIPILAIVELIVIVGQPIVALRPAGQLPVRLGEISGLSLPSWVC
jgi:hypothetical protein